MGVLDPVVIPKDKNGRKLSTITIPSVAPLARARPAAMASVVSTMPSPPTLSLNKGSGVSGVSVASGGTGYVAGDTITVAGGTAAVPAIIGVVAVSGGVITGAYVKRPGIYSGFPSSPAAQASTTGSGTGATFTLSQGGASGSAISDATYRDPTNTAFFRFTGVGPTNQSGSGFYGNGGSGGGNGVASTFEWRTDAQTFDIRLLGFNSNFMLYVDGVRVNNAGAQTDSSGGVFLWTVTNATRVVRNYKLWGINMAFGGLFATGSDTVWAPPEVRRPLWWALGDSYTYGTNATHPSMAGINTMCDLLGYECLASGIGGSGWLTAAPTDPVTRIQQQLAQLTKTPEVVSFDFGFNDVSGSTTNVTTSINAAVAAARTAVPNAFLIAFGVATPTGSSANSNTMNSTIKAACIALGVAFVDPTDWVSGTNRGAYTAGDNTHPTQAGYDYLAARRAHVVSTLIPA